MRHFEQEKYNLKLLKNITCTKCRSKSLEISELFTASNIYTTDGEGVVQKVEVCVVETIDPIAIHFRCLNCNHSFKKRKIALLSETLNETD